MPIFIWQGTDRKGARAKGEIESDNIVIARELLLRQGVTIRRLKPKPRDLLDYLPFLQGRVKERDLVIFVRQLATMIDAGVPIVQCLEVLREQSENKTFKVVLKDVTKEVEAGATLHESLEKHPKVFDNLFCNLTAAGEAGGILDVILNRLANYIEKTAKLKKRIRGAMTYPGVVVSVAISVVIVILLYVIPVFAGLFKDAGAPLPPIVCPACGGRRLSPLARAVTLAGQGLPEPGALLDADLPDFRFRTERPLDGKGAGKVDAAADLSTVSLRRHEER